MVSTNATVRKQHPVDNPSILSRTVSGLFSILKWLFIALMLSVLLEWIGMSFFWEKEGILHSQEMLKNEISYLNEDFRKSIITSSPARFAKKIANVSFYYMFEVTGFVDLIQWLNKPVIIDDSWVRLKLRTIYIPVSDYIVAAMTISQLFAIRLAVLILALPAFFMMAVVALTDGFVQRDLRRWGGGRESSFIYHHAKIFIMPSLILAWIIYLSMPVSIHPNYIILPFVCLFAIALAVTATTFKKYL